MPNIGAFLAWGLIMALFMPNGWCPDETIAGLVSPMAMVLFPLLIAYAGGSVVDGQRGGVAGAVAVMGLVADSDIPMILGAMVIGPASGWVMKQVDRVIEGRARAGFEMLVNNFSLGITGAVLAVIVLKGFMPPMRALHKLMESGLGFVTEHGLIPLASVFIESSKFFFLNNAVNHGIAG